jgi:hypothetical protein
MHLYREINPRPRQIFRECRVRGLFRRSEKIPALQARLARITRHSQLRPFHRQFSRRVTLHHSLNMPRGN